MAESELMSPEELEDLLEEPYREGLIHQSVVAFRANQRQATAHSKTRAEVSGPNSKPWPQKGTGRARHGSEKSPLWVGGGRSHGPTGRENYKQKLTRTMRRKAFRSAVSERFRGDGLHLVEPPDLEEPSTSTLHEWFEELGLTEEKNLLLLDPEERTLRLSVRNLPYCQPYDAGSVPTYDIVGHPVVLLTGGGQDLLKERLNDA